MGQALNFEDKKEFLFFKRREIAAVCVPVAAGGTSLSRGGEIWPQVEVFTETGGGGAPGQRQAGGFRGGKSRKERRAGRREQDASRGAGSLRREKKLQNFHSETKGMNEQGKYSWISGQN